MLKKFFIYLLLFGVAGAASLAMLITYSVILARPNLPSLEVITDYRPKVPLRIFTADNEMVGEIG